MVKILYLFNKLLSFYKKNISVQNVFLDILILCFIIFTIVVSTYTYRPSYDEAWQLQAATRLSTLNELTVSMDDIHNWNENDLSKNLYTYLTNWPSGYSISIAFLNKLGLSITLSAQIFQIIFLLVATVFWTILGYRYIRFPLLRFIFVFIILFYVFNIRHTNLANFALFPILTLLMLSFHKEDKSIKLIFPGIAVSLAIAFRYQSVVFIPIGVIWLFYINRKNIKIFFTQSFIFSITPIFIYLSILYFNRLYGTDLWTEKVLSNTVNWKTVWLVWASKAVFIESVRLDSLFLFLLKLIHLNNISENFLNIMGVLSVLFIMAVVFYSIKKQETKLLVVWFAISFLCNFFMLIVVTLFQSDLTSKLTPLNVSRYYIIFGPLIFLFIFIYIQDLNKLLKLLYKLRYFIVILVLSVTIFNTFSYAKKHNILEYTSKKKLLNSRIELVKNKYPNSNLIAFTTVKSGLHTYLIPEDYVPTFRYIENIENICFSDSTLVLFLLNKKDYIRLSNSSFDPQNLYDYNFLKLAKIIGMEKVKFDDLIIYYRLFYNEKLLK